MHAQIRSHFKLVAAALLLATALVSAGCLTPPTDDDGHHHDDGHHDDHHGDDSGTLPITGAEDTSIAVTGGEPSELRFTPDRIEVDSGDRVGIRFTNQGDAEHEFSIKSLGFHLHAASGEVKEGAFMAPGPGEYEIGCYIPGHFEGGMKATLVVV